VVTDMLHLHTLLRKGALAIAALALSTACATTQAKSKASEAAALDAPPPPPRVIAPTELESSAPAVPTTEDPIRTNLPPRSPTRPQRDASAGRAETKPEPPKPETETPKPNEGPPTEAPPVHRLQPANEAEQERSTRDRIAAADRDLSRVDYGKLSAAVKNEYNNAKGLLEQAKDALRNRNFVFAYSLAEKAATIAASLK
jgi:hypothetical protein